jgi:hypothetical protein
MRHPARYLTERGTLFYNGRTSEESFLSRFPFKGGVVLEADWNGKVLWEVRHPDHHHHGILLRNGNVLLHCMAEVPLAVAAPAPRRCHPPRESFRCPIWPARELSVSAVPAVGPFATSPIKKRAFIVEYKGRKLTSETVASGLKFIGLLVSAFGRHE